MVQTMRALLEFCYLAWRDIHDTHSLAALDDALQRFHHHREIFCTSGACADGFNLPRQHSLIHYVKLICAYGAPNSLCSSITESKHIKAVKELWQHSSRFDMLSQMLLTNQWASQQVCCCLGWFHWPWDATRHMSISSLGSNSLYASQFPLWWSSKLIIQI